MGERVVRTRRERHRDRERESVGEGVGERGKEETCL